MFPWVAFLPIILLWYILWLDSMDEKEKRKKSKLPDEPAQAGRNASVSNEASEVSKKIG